MSTATADTSVPSQPALSAPGPGAGTTAAPSQGSRKALVIGIAIAVLLVVAAAIGAAVALVNRPALAASVRDVVIIFMAIEFMLLGAALVILIFQIAVLTNMLRHEIKPILESTSETIHTLRGTTVFLSDNLVEPVMKLNAYVAAISSVLDNVSALVGLGRRK